MLDVFDGDVTGRDFPRGKPDPMIFLAAAEELGLAPEACFVVEDASSGMHAAKAGRMSAIGVARLNDEALLSEAGADLVVTTLDDVAVSSLMEGRLERRSAAVSPAHAEPSARRDHGGRRSRNSVVSPGLSRTVVPRKAQGDRRGRSWPAAHADALVGDVDLQAVPTVVDAEAQL